MQKLVVSVIAVGVLVITSVGFYRQTKVHEAKGRSTQTRTGLVKQYDYPVVYDAGPSKNGQWGFYTIPAVRQRVKLIPNIAYCQQKGVYTINNITGANQFFLDLDLVSGFVHPYTINFFKRQAATDYVMRYEKIKGEQDEGYVQFVKKADLKTSDSLGQNLVYFRQWKLSEIDIIGDSIRMQKCKFAQSCLCPQTKASATNPFSELPIWYYGSGEGYKRLSQFNTLGERQSCTVTIIWEDTSTNEILFTDVHASLSQIIKNARQIVSEKGVDPVIAISDAGVVAVKFKADHGMLDLKPIQKLAPGFPVGAGYGYVPMRGTVYETKNEGVSTLDTVIGAE